MKLRLQTIAGPYAGREFVFEGHDTFFVGRGTQAHFQIRDSYFSRLHFMVEMNPPLCRVTDVHSSNGTIVNGQRVTVADLRHGDVIHGGDTSIRVLIESDAPTADRAPPSRNTPSTPSAASEPTILPARAEAAMKTRPIPAVVLPPTTPYLPRAAAAARSTICCVCGSTDLAAGQLPLCRECAAGSSRREQFLPGYTLIRELGRGGMGVVDLAASHALGQAVAIKMIHPEMEVDEKDIARFLREAEILRQLDHPRIVRFRDLGTVGQGVYFAMDYVRGEDAGRILRQARQPIALRRAIVWTCQLLEALTYAHAGGFVHRDLKPQNLLIEQQAGQEAVKLADFGLARVYQSSSFSGLTLQGDLAGTLAFMSPEQVLNLREARPAADLYSAGATLFTLLTGRFIYDMPKETSRQLHMILNQPPISLETYRPDLPSTLSKVIERALAREPGQRFGSAEEFRQVILSFA